MINSENIREKKSINTNGTCQEKPEYRNIEQISWNAALLKSLLGQFSFKDQNDA